MHILSLSVAVELVRTIEDPLNPGRARDALATRDKWLLEHRLGTLEISDEVIRVLANAKPAWCRFE